METNPSRGYSIGEHLNSVAQEPLTPLTKILLVLGLVLLLTSSVRQKHAQSTVTHAFGVVLGIHWTICRSSTPFELGPWWRKG